MHGFRDCFVSLSVLDEAAARAHAQQLQQLESELATARAEARRALQQQRQQNQVMRASKL